MNYGFICGIFAVVMSSIGYIFQAYKIYCVALMNIAYIFYFISIMDIIGILGAVIPLILLFINMILKYYYSTKQKQVLIK